MSTQPHKHRARKRFGQNFLCDDGIINRIVDYNGTMLLVLRRLGLAKNLEIAPQFA